MNLMDLAIKRGKSVARVLIWGDDARQFRGSFVSFDQAIRSVRANKLAGYNHSENALIEFQAMSGIRPWDYPVIYWLYRLIGQSSSLLDLGGHMGTKFRAFQRHLNFPDGFTWAVYDLPAIAAAGRERARKEGLSGISFFDDLKAMPQSDLALASGLLQYLDTPFTDFMQALPKLPRHLVLNKVATCEGPTRVSLECFPESEVPYQVRNKDEFQAELAGLGYEIEDQWTIPSFSHKHPAWGISDSRGYYAKLAS